jgi:large subunit ribosomal protein L28
MSKKCFFCGKKSSGGNVVQRRGMAKVKGGVGKKTTSITKRKFKPNLQRVKAEIKGAIQRVLACTKCIKKNKVKRPQKKPTL